MTRKYPLSLYFKLHQDMIQNNFNKLNKIENHTEFYILVKFDVN